MAQIDREKGRWTIQLSASKYEFGFGFRLFWHKYNYMDNSRSWWFNLRLSFLFFAAEINYDSDD